ncbi:MAG: hypothetical protein SGARI_000235 [Bacillariaceae sp.]
MNDMLLAEAIFEVETQEYLRAHEEQSNNVGHFFGSCNSSHLIMTKNEYYTPDGAVTIICESDTHHTLKEMQEQFGLEAGSRGGKLPGDAQIIEWAQAILSA